MITINFDMDGTIADLYNVENWMRRIDCGDPTAYTDAKPLLNMSALARRLNSLQRKGYHIAIISWLSRSGNEDFHAQVAEAKMAWLKEHLPSVHFDEIHLVKYGIPKQTYCYDEEDILFDDNRRVRAGWTGQAYDVQNILEVLKNLN